MVKRLLLMLLVVCFMAPAAMAVEVNPGGKGDALIMGYYNARNALTYIRIVNTNPTKGIIGKLRFREGKNSEEVLDFVVCLSPGDEFSAILMDPGEGQPAVLYKGTDMISDSDTTTVPDGWTSVYLRYASTGAASTVDVEDTKEGYIEFIAYSAYSGVDTLTSDQCKDIVEGGTVEGVTVENASNDLMAEVDIVKYTDNLPNFAYKALALADTSDHVITGASATGADDPLFHTILSNNNSAQTIEDLNALLNKSAFYAFYDIREDLGAKTDLVITFPTKKETAAYAPAAYDDYFTENDNTCVTVKFDVYDDQENTITQEIDFSPYTVQTNSLCYEVNYIMVGSVSSILDTDLNTVSVQTGDFDFGWLKVYFENNKDNYVPAIGYELQTWADGALSRMLELAYDANVD